MGFGKAHQSSGVEIKPNQTKLEKQKQQNKQTKTKQNKQQNTNKHTKPPTTLRTPDKDENNFSINCGTKNW